MYLRLCCLLLALPFASCGPVVGEEYEDPTTGTTVRVLGSGGCDAVREEGPEVARRERQKMLDASRAFDGTDAGSSVGAIDTTAVPVPVIVDETALELDESASSCVAFVVTSVLNDSGLVTA